MFVVGARGGEGDGPLGMELASNLNKVGGNLDLLWVTNAHVSNSLVILLIKVAVMCDKLCVESE